MKVLVIGSGGREHALVWKIAQSPNVKHVFAAPGNAGMAAQATLVPIGANEIDALVEFVKQESIDLTVVGPEDPLSKGIVDRLHEEGFKAFGASQKAATLEASKSFAKSLMNKYHIPTAKGETFTTFKKAEKYIKTLGVPLVVKADGLAAGKGVMVCTTEKEAMAALNQIMTENAFGDAGKKVVIEECLIGEEASFLALTDGKTVLPLPSSQDHKRIFDNDKGPNTGGMGAYSPAPVIDAMLHKKIMDEIMIPTVRAMEKEGIPYKGILYAGLMINKDKVHVLEFNARFGDPEAQPLMVRIKNDLVELMEAVISETLHEQKMIIDERPSACVVMAAKGYPGSYKKGLPITGINAANRMRDVVVFHAGTDQNNKKTVTNGGRVLGVTALGDTIEKAIEQSYKAVKKIKWQGAYSRQDIGQKAIRLLNIPPQVGIVMGSDSDLPVMMEIVKILKKFGITYEMTVASAHRTPQKAADFASQAKDRGMKVIIAGAGHAAHLAGAMAAHTTLPVIGVPIDSSALSGMDALLSTVQMPPGIPVATVAIGKPGATNAGILAVQMIALSDPEVAELLVAYKQEMVRKVEEKASKLGGYIA